jgi:hypothetical protein
MAQSALTVTPPSPTPPTNLSSVGATPPNPPNYSRRSVGPPPDIITNPPPFFDDGVPAFTGVFASLNETASSPSTAIGTKGTFAANTAALASGTSAADNNTGSTAGTVVTAAGGTGFNSVSGSYPLQGGLVPASSSVAHEGAGTETVATQSYSAAVLHPVDLVTVGAGPNASAASILAGPNASHASTLSPTTNPTLSSITPGSTVSGVGTTTLGATGVGFTRQSVIYVNGVAQNTTFNSSTSLTAPAVTKKTTAGPWLVNVITGGVVTTAPQTWTFT